MSTPDQANTLTLGSLLATILRLLSPREKRQLLLLLPAVALMGVVETVGIAAIVPFLALLSNPDAITQEPWLAWASQELGFTSWERFLFAVGLCVLAVLTLGNLFSALTNWALLRFSWMRNHSLSKRLLEAYAAKPYAFFLTHHTSGLTQRLLSEVQEVVARIIVQVVLLWARCMVVACILAALLILEPALSIGVALVLGVPYGLLFLFIRNKLHALGEERVRANELRFKYATELLSGIKEVRLLGLERAFLNRFEVPSWRYAAAFANAQVIGQIPKYALETLAFGGLLLMVLYLLWQEREFSQIIPFLGLYAFAALRLLPGLQIIFAGVSGVKNNLASLQAVVQDLPSEAPFLPLPGQIEPLPFESNVALRGVRYGYGEGRPMVLDGLDLDIPAGSWVALVGSTGSGKSTIVDLLLGLLWPTEGELIVDGQPVRPEQDRAWQQNCAYVPQQIFLTDDTLASNIAFGEAADKVDRARLRQAAAVAQILGFIEEELPSGFETLAGERGARLSGGQRQRIGIARALYRRPRLLVLDEATSALDGETEQALFRTLREELEGCTVISIAHRLTTTRGFDRIYVVEQGAIIDAGTYEELCGRHQAFAQQAAQPVP